MLIVIIWFTVIFMQGTISLANADEGIASHLICPCECEMLLSTCDCPTAVIVRNEITSMTGNGFSENQIISALVKEYSNDIIIPERKDTAPLWAGSIILLVVLVLVGYFAARKPDPYIIPDSEKYKKQFDEEYRRFVEMEEK